MKKEFLRLLFQEQSKIDKRIEELYNIKDYVVNSSDYNCNKREIEVLSSKYKNFEVLIDNYIDLHGKN